MIMGVALTSGKMLLILTELCEQGSLRDFMRLYGAEIPAQVKMKILFDIAKGIFYLHSRQPPLIHRDLKPENILLSSDLRAKVCDFGISKQSKSDPTYSSNTTATLRYMSPESLSKSIYTSKSDIYSFGIIAFELLTDKKAFSGIEGFELIESVSVLGIRPLFPSSFNNKIKNLIQKCWLQNSEDRPDANHICSELKDIINAIDCIPN